MDIMGNLSRKGQRTRRTNKSNPQAAVENNLCPIVNTLLNFCPLTCEASGLGSRFGSGHQIVFSVKPRSLQQSFKAFVQKGKPDKTCRIYPRSTKKRAVFTFTFLTPHPGKPRNTREDKSLQAWAVFGRETRGLLYGGFCCLRLIFGTETSDIHFELFNRMCES